jgi:hypothetical protein
VLTARMLLVNCAPSMCASSTRYRFSSMPYTLAHSLSANDEPHVRQWGIVSVGKPRAAEGTRVTHGVVAQTQ